MLYFTILHKLKALLQKTTQNKLLFCDEGYAWWVLGIPGYCRRQGKLQAIDIITEFKA